MRSRSKPRRKKKELTDFLRISPRVQPSSGPHFLCGPLVNRRTSFWSPARTTVCAPKHQAFGLTGDDGENQRRTPTARAWPPPLPFSDCRLPGNRKHRSKADFSLFRQHSPVLKVLAEGNSSNLNTGTMSKNHEGIYSCQIWLLKKRKKNAPRNISGLVGLYSILVLRSFRVLQNVLKRLHAV